MKKIIAMLIMVIGTLTATMCNVGAYGVNTRCEDASVYKIDWGNDERDYCIATIETADGNLWDVEDYVVPRSAKLLATFDNSGTPDYIYDDIIIQIVAVNNF